jgi:hypothetical protein
LFILLYVIGVGLLVVVSSAMRWRILTRAESAWLPFISFWVYGLAYFYVPSPTVQVGAGMSIVLTVMAGWLARHPALRTPSLTGLSVTGAVLAALSFSSLDPTGIAWAAAALGVLFVSREIISNFLGVFSHLLVIGSVIVAFWRGQLLALAHTNWDIRILGGLSLGLLLFGHYYLAGNSRKSRGKVEANRLLAPLTLFWAVVVFFCVMRLTAFQIFAAGNAYQLSQTVTLTGLAIAALSVGKWLNKQVWYYIGLLGIAVLTFRVVFFDMFSLQGSYLLGSVCSLGAASVMTSLALRRREPKPDKNR